MTSSERDTSEASAILEIAASMLDERTSSRQIDEPIDAVLEEFVSGLCPDDSADMLESVAGFVQRVHGTALPVRRSLTSAQARDEAMSLLRTGYQGTHADGYAGAVLDSFGEESPGISLVIARVAEALKARRRQEYTQWVESRWIQAASWPVRCAMATLLVSRLADLLPPELRNCRPDHLADHVHELLAVHLGTESRLLPTSLADFNAGSDNP